MYVLRKLVAFLWLTVSEFLCPAGMRRVVHSSINGHSLLVFANEDVGRAIHYGGRYEALETAFLTKTISPEAICVDVGANVGYFTMLMANSARTGSVHAFEPLPMNVALLKASIELNGFTNIHVNQCAVGDRTGEISFVQSTDTAYSSLRDTGRKLAEHAFRVPMITLDDYLERVGITRVDVIKADVEGSEELVVEGATKLLNNRAARPRLVLLELFNHNLQAFGSSVAGVVQKMGSLGYAPFVLNRQGHTIPFTPAMAARHYNVWFRPAH